MNGVQTKKGPADRNDRLGPVETVRGIRVPSAVITVSGHHLLSRDGGYNGCPDYRSAPVIPGSRIHMLGMVE